MGIRFLCPNGHKVHVKAYLAGKKGHCPRCGTIVTVPTADSLPETVDDVAFGEADDVEFARTPAPASAPPSTPPPAPDPLTDPLAVWYVHLPTGQQLGPAGGREMQRWLQQGAVAPSALVWRDGWADWQPASRVFLPQSIGPAALSPTPVAAAIGIDTSQSPVPSVAMFQRRSRRRVPASVTIMLMGLVVVLFAIAMYVFVFRN